MAVMPSLSYSSDGSNLSPVTPHYSSKFMDNSPSSLDPNASVYQPLKKWLWLSISKTGLGVLLYLLQSFQFQVFFFFSWKTPDNFCTLKCHRKTHNPSLFVCIWLHFQFGSEDYDFLWGSSEIFCCWKERKGRQTRWPSCTEKPPRIACQSSVCCQQPHSYIFLYSNATFWFCRLRWSGFFLGQVFDWRPHVTMR